MKYPIDPNNWNPITSGSRKIPRFDVQDVVSTAVSLSLGEAIVATANGDVVAAKDMVTWSLGSRSAELMATRISGYRKPLGNSTKP